VDREVVWTPKQRRQPTACVSCLSTPLTSSSAAPPTVPAAFPAPAAVACPTAPPAASHPRPVENHGALLNGLEVAPVYFDAGSHAGLQGRAGGFRDGSCPGVAGLRLMRAHVCGYDESLREGVTTFPDAHASMVHCPPTYLPRLWRFKFDECEAVPPALRLKVETVRLDGTKCSQHLQR
jgi:hypothetical protein